MCVYKQQRQIWTKIEQKEKETTIMMLTMLVMMIVMMIFTSMMAIEKTDWFILSHQIDFVNKMVSCIFQQPILCFLLLLFENYSTNFNPNTGKQTIFFSLSPSLLPFRVFHTHTHNRNKEETPIQRNWQRWKIKRRKKS